MHPHGSLLLLLQLLLVDGCCASSSSEPSGSTPAHQPRRIVVVGSINADTTVHVGRLPAKGETFLTSLPSSFAVGGKGANQAVAAARLLPPNPTDRTAAAPVSFVGRLGDDAQAATLHTTLTSAGVDTSSLVRVPGVSSGQGFVMLEPDGAASSIVVAGANGAWPEQDPVASGLLDGAGAVLLQREVPERINQAVAAMAASANVPVLLDVGGEAAAPLPEALLRLLAVVSPNELELQAITAGMPMATEEQVIAAAKTLTQRGAARVLVTLAERGALLVGADGSVLKQPPLPVPGDGAVVDGTAAGDAFRAAFAVGLVSGWPPEHCLQLAAAAGALAVSRAGALPSLPTLQEVAAHLEAHASLVAPELLAAVRQSLQQAQQQQAQLPAMQCSSSNSSSSAAPAAACTTAAAGAAGQRLPPGAPPPFQLAARLNSMASRRDLVPAAQQRSGKLTNDVLGWIRRQGQARGLGQLHLNYPQHFADRDGRRITPAQLLEAAQQAGGRSIGAINIRFPADTFERGAFTHPDAAVREAAVALAADGCRAAVQLGARHVVVWSPYDGFDLPLQMDYRAAWRHTVEAWRALAAACPPGVRLSLEPKPSDAATRFALVPTTAMGLLLLQEVGAPSVGLTLDLGHMLLAGEAPGQSVAAAIAAGRLHGLHLNDAFAAGREDGLPFASVQPHAALDVVLQLQLAGWRDGFVYFDTFPGPSMDPVAEAEANVHSFQRVWHAAAKLRASGWADLAATHDALGVLRLLDGDAVDAEEEGGGGAAAAAV